MRSADFAWSKISAQVVTRILLVLVLAGEAGVAASALNDDITFYIDIYPSAVQSSIAQSLYFNSRLALKVEEEWVNIYGLLTIDRLSPAYKAKQNWWYHDYNEYAERSMAACKELLKQLIAEKTGENA